MYSDWLVMFGWVIIFIWLGILTYLIWRQNNFLKALFPKSPDRDVRKKFEEVLKEVENFGQDLKSLKEKLMDVEEDGLEHIQKVALLRYNPYDDTGGNMSFSVAFLDNEGSGLVITSLHARSETRIFAKSVKGGKAYKYQFSEEEDQVVKEALKN